jgi:hypothetical protein
MAESYIKKVVAGGIQINEIIKNFKVAPGQTITAGTFVDYINQTTVGSQTQPDSSDSLFAFSSAALTDTKAIIVYGRPSGAPGACRIITVTDSFISVGSEHYLPTSITQTETAVVALDSTKVVIMYSNASGNQGNVIVGNISGDTISFGSAFPGRAGQIYGETNSQSLRATKLNDNQVVFCYLSSSSLNVILISISGTNVSFLIDRNVGFSIGAPDIQKINDTSVLVAYSADNLSRRLACYIFTVNGSEFNIYQLSSSITGIGTTGPSSLSLVRINSSQFYVVFRNSDTSLGNITRITVNNGAVTYNSVSTFPGNFQQIRMANLSDSKLLIAYRNNSTLRGDAFIATVNQDNYIFNSSFVFSGNNNMTFINIAPLTSSIGLIFYSNRRSDFLGVPFLVRVNDETVLTNTTASKVFGLAKTGGTAGQIVEVYTNV